MSHFDFFMSQRTSEEQGVTSYGWQVKNCMPSFVHLLHHTHIDHFSGLYSCQRSHNHGTPISSSQLTSFPNLFNIIVILIVYLVSTFVFVIIVAILLPSQAEKHVHHGGRRKIEPDLFARTNSVGFVLHLSKARSL
jgi:hypothetical protein